MDVFDVFSWVGTAFNLAAFYVMPNNKKRAIQIILSGSIFWIMWSIHDKAWSILTIQIFYGFFNLRTLYIWKKEDKE